MGTLMPEVIVHRLDGSSTLAYTAALSLPLSLHRVPTTTPTHNKKTTIRIFKILSSIIRSLCFLLQVPIS
jgi:hypothetical protein